MGIERLFTSESVVIGHPDKLADQISDGVLDSVLRQDPEGRVACEIMVPSGGIVIVGGEISTKAWVDIKQTVKKVVKRAGYTNPDYGFDCRTVAVSNLIKAQSPDIAYAVNPNKGLHKKQGAGDQGMMFGFAIREAAGYMPLPISLAHKLARRLERVRKKGVIEYLRPDGKTQVTIEYDNAGKPLGVHTVVVSAQHDPGIKHKQIVEDITEHVIMPVVGDRVSSSTVFYVNPSGRFVLGGPAADVGLTGRKIVVDAYGGGSFLYRAGNGGGSFSGKDPSKIDRSGAYAARYIAKNIVAANAAYVCEVQLAYAIGIAEPVSVMVNTFGTGRMPDEELAQMVRDNFPLTPADIINHFDLKRPIYLPTACYGHFGRKSFPWEKTDKKDLF